MRPEDRPDATETLPPTPDEVEAARRYVAQLDERDRLADSGDASPVDAGDQL